MACQPEEGVANDCPCAKKRVISSSLANSARIVVFPKTHLQKNSMGGESFLHMAQHPHSKDGSSCFLCLFTLNTTRASFVNNGIA